MMIHVVLQMRRMVPKSNLHDPHTAQVWSWTRGERISTGPAAQACFGVEEAAIESSSVMQRSTHDSLFLVVNIVWIHSSLMRETSSGYFSSPAVFLTLLFAAKISLIGETQRPFAAAVCV
jgi:hypothetical protein